MTQSKALVSGSLLAIALALAPVSSAFADGNHWHGSSWHGGSNWHGGYHYGVWPVFGVAAAVVGTAAALITLPFAAIAAAANAPYYYGPGPAYAPTAYSPPAYYGQPAAPYYESQGVAPQAYSQAAPQAYYNAPAAPAYYGPPAAPAYYAAPAPTYYAPPARIYYSTRAAPAYYGGSYYAPAANDVRYYNQYVR